jgi:NAD(P)-dependent dehydrogenase (short-subunit alcohol dehydrogenase family)
MKKRVLITGGNSGIGRGIVHHFVQAGAEVTFTARDSAKGVAVEAETAALGNPARFIACDLSVEAQVQELIAKLNGLDVLVNNAGLGSRRAEVDTSDSPGTRWDKLRGPNLDSTWLVSAHALPLLAQSGRGAIVNISSTATLHGNWGLYCVAKAAVEALTRSLAAEGAPYGIRANCISPGWIETQTDAATPATGGGNWDVPPSLFNRMGTPEEIAAAVAFLASDAASFITGQTLLVDGGLSIIDYTSRKLLESRGQNLFSGMFSRGKQ